MGFESLELHFGPDQIDSRSRVWRAIKQAGGTIKSYDRPVTRYYANVPADSQAADDALALGPRTVILRQLSDELKAELTVGVTVPAWAVVYRNVTDRQTLEECIDVACDSCFHRRARWQ